MAIDDLLAMVATITTPGPSATLNSMGDPVPGPATTAVAPCWCEQLSTDELTAGTDMTRQHWKLYTVAVISSTSQVTVDAYPGIVFDVDGVPWLAVLPISNEASHVETLLVVTAGASSP